MSYTVAKKPAKENKTARVEFKAEPGWIAKVEETAQQLGLDVSGYIRLATSERMNEDRRKLGLDKPETGLVT
jgi:hypothetical protein